MMALLPLLLVSLASTGIEIALTRYFAVASWSEYGYWVISIVMAGFALSGVFVALARDWLERHAAWLFAFLPAALIATAACGYALVIRNPFNPLQLQNPVTIAPSSARWRLMSGNADSKQTSGPIRSAPVSITT